MAGPENGPAVAVSSDNRVHVAWPAPPDGKSDTQLGLFYATSVDGRSFGPRAQIPATGPVAHVQMAIADDGRPIVVWDEMAEGGRRIVAARVTRHGADAPTF